MFIIQTPIIQPRLKLNFDVIHARALLLRRWHVFGCCKRNQCGCTLAHRRSRAVNCNVYVDKTSPGVRAGKGNVDISTSCMTPLHAAARPTNYRNDGIRVSDNRVRRVFKYRHKESGNVARYYTVNNSDTHVDRRDSKLALQQGMGLRSQQWYWVGFSDPVDSSTVRKDLTHRHSVGFWRSTHDD